MNGSARAHLEKVVFAVVAAVVVAGGLLSLAIVTSSAPQGAATPSRSSTPNVALAQTVLYRSYDGFQVCTRRTLHDCVLMFVRSDGGDRSVIRIGPLDIEPAAECSNIRSDATEWCGDAGVDPFHDLPSGRGRGPTREWVSCAARRGFLYRGGPTTTTVDPRDESPALRALPPGRTQLQCSEGFALANSSNTL